MTGLAASPVTLMTMACLGAGLLTWLARRYALRRQLFDLPGERRSHQVATPRGGGVAIVVMVLVLTLLAALQWPQARTALLLFATGLLLVAGIGWWDDHRPLPALQRLVIHVIASALLAIAAFLHGAASWQLALVFLLAVSLVNIWNFMDGINGIASTQAIVAALGFAVVVPAPWSLAPLAVAAACLGFLPFNFPKARIFMGDVGSGALGYAMAALFTVAWLAVPTLSWPLAFVPFTAFLVDAGFTLLSRMLSRQRWMEPHTQHVYQRAVKAGAGHPLVTSVYALLGLLGSLLLLRSAALAPLAQTGVALAWWAFSTCLWLLARWRLRHY